MLPFKHLLARALLALAMLCGVDHASAMPVYKVAIDTSSLAGQSGYVDLLMLGLSGATPVQAHVSGFSGTFGAGSFTLGDASGSVAGGVTIGNGGGWNEFAQWADFGGAFTFDLVFDPAFNALPSGPGTRLAIALLDSQFNYLGTAADIVTFALQPGEPDAVSANAAFASVNAVAEPGGLPLMAAGLAMLLGYAARRRQRH